MKKKIMGAIGVLLVVLPGEQLFAQSTNANNNAGAPSYLGWDNTVTDPLTIRHYKNLNIEFYTNNTFIADPRMIIYGPNGFVRIGTNTTVPVSMLHIDADYTGGTGNVFRTDGLAASDNLWQMFTGGTEKFHINVPASSSPAVRISAVDLDGTLNLQTGNATRLFIQKASVTSVDGVDAAGFVGIGTTSPRAPLHIVGNQIANAAPWRRGLVLSNRASIYFDGGADSSFFMAHNSSEGNFYCGSTPNMNASQQPIYAYSVMVSTDNYAAGNPQNSTVFYKNLLIYPHLSNGTINASNERKLGVNTGSPGNVVEINTAVTTPSGSGNSGLRFTDLTSATTPVSTNPGNGVLAVDADGDVIYVQASGGSGGSGFGNLCTASDVPLPDDFEIPMADHNYHFTGNNLLNQNHVGIGYNCGISLPGKLSVFQDHPATVASSTIGISGINDDVADITDLTYTGVEGQAIGVQTVDKAINRGGYFTASNSKHTRGVVAEILPSATNTVEAYAGQFSVDTESDDNIGVLGEATGSETRNIGGVFIAKGVDLTAISIGVYGKATGGISQNYGVCGVAATGTNSYAGFFNGDVFSTTGNYLPSDKNLKQNIQDYKQANDVLSQLHLVSYDFRTKDYPQLNLSQSHQVGLISQELEKILPDAVKETTSLPINDENGKELYPAVTFKAVAYEKLIPILVGGHQEQQEEIALLREQNSLLQRQNSELNTRLTELENCLKYMLPGLCETSQGSVEQNSPDVQQTIAVNLSNKNAIVLNQNVPNPFAESTIISYSIPATVKKAQIHFYDVSGKLLQSVEISERGNGRLQVFGNDLSSGTYTYTLVADDEVAAAKKLVKQ